MEQKYQYNTVEEAIRDLQDGKIILVTDDPDRENEGDMICAAQFATQENINFMATHAKGLICTPMSAELAAKLNFPQMVSENTDNHETAFTVSIDHVDTTTATPASLNIFAPFPATFGFGSLDPITTFFIFCSKIASVHGGVFP